MVGARTRCYTHPRHDERRSAYPISRCVYPRATLRGSRTNISSCQWSCHGVSPLLLTMMTNSQLASLRTTVSSQAAILYAELAAALGPSLDPFVDSLLQQLVRMAGFTKKLAVQQTQAAVTAIITHTSPQPRVVLPHLVQALSDKTVSTRQYAIEHTGSYIRTHGEKYQAYIESYGGLETIDKLIRKALVDANPGVKSKARDAYWVFFGVWPTQAKAISASLDTTALKQLDKANPHGNTTALIGVSFTPAPKKASVASVIAASRAKAKAIATAPPTLRHAATSGATAAAQRAGTGPSSPSATMGRATSSRNISSPVANQSANATTRRSQSPSPTQGPSSAATPSRTVSASSSLRSPPSTSHRSIATSPASSPPSSPTVELTSRRKTLSPLAYVNPAHNSFTKATPTHTPSASQSTHRISPPNFTKTHSRPNSRASLNGAITTNVSHQRTSSSSSLHRLQQHERTAHPMHIPRESIMLDDGNADTSLLMAVQNPLPNDSDEEEDLDDSMLIETTMRLPVSRDRDRPGIATGPSSQTTSIIVPPESPQRSQSSIRTLFPGDSISQTATTHPKQLPPHSPTSDVAVMEDALRANAEQAEGSAERLAELLEPESATLPIFIVPAGQQTLNHSRSFSNMSTPVPPVTPVPKSKAASNGNKLFSHLALFQASPAAKSSPSVMDRLYENKAEGGWWLKRRSCESFASTACFELTIDRLNFSLTLVLETGTPLKNIPGSMSETDELRVHIAALKDGTANVRTLQKLVLLCHNNPAAAVDGDHTPTLLSGDATSPREAIWEGGKMFDALMNALLPFLRSSKVRELDIYRTSPIDLRGRYLG